MDDETPIDDSLADAVRRVLDEGDVDAESALVALAEALVDRHVDVELRKLGRRTPYSIGNARADALVGAMDALFEAKHRAPADDATPEGAARQAAIALLTACQFVAERVAGLDGGDDDAPDDDDDRPPMRLADYGP